MPTGKIIPISDIDGKIKQRTSLDGKIAQVSDIDGTIQKSKQMSGSYGYPTETDHIKLINRDKPNQHPIDAITGLASELARRAIVSVSSTGTATARANYITINGIEYALGPAIPVIDEINGGDAYSY